VNLLQSRIVLRDRKPLDVLDLALRFLVEHRIAFLKVGAVTLVPGTVVTYLIGEELGWAWGWLFAIYLGLLAQAPFTELASRLVFERDVRVRSVLRATLARIGFVGMVRVVQLVSVAVATLFFFVPGLLLSGLFFFLGEVLLLERAGMGTALSRLQRLVTGASGEAMLGFLLLSFLHVGATLLGDVGGRTVLTELLSWKAPAPAWEDGGSLLAALGFWLFLPYAAVARFFLYLNVRTRAEGWDVQTRFSSIARAAEADESDSREAVRHTGRQAGRAA
jgi:hypothetical protein